MKVVEGKSERKLVTELTLLGHRLYNSNSGIRSAAKKLRDDTFAVINREAEARLALREAAEARRNRLRGVPQRRSKSEVVRQRITGDAPTVEALLACEWREAPVEMMGGAVARTADECEYFRWGDYTIHIGYRKKRKHSTCGATHPQRATFYASGAGVTHCGKE